MLQSLEICIQMYDMRSYFYHFSGIRLTPYVDNSHEKPCAIDRSRHVDRFRVLGCYLTPTSRKVMIMQNFYFKTILECKIFKISLDAK